MRLTFLTGNGTRQLLFATNMPCNFWGGGRLRLWQAGVLYPTCRSLAQYKVRLLLTANINWECRIDTASAGGIALNGEAETGRAFERLG